MAGSSRFLFCAVASTVLHALVLAGMAERPRFALSAPGEAHSFAIRLVPAGPERSDPATSTGAAGSESRSAEAPARRQSPAAEPPQQPTETAAVRSPETADEKPAAPSRPARLDRRLAHVEPSNTGKAADAERAARTRQPDGRPTTSSPSETPHPTSADEPLRERHGRPGTTAARADQATEAGANGRADRAQREQRARRQVAIELRRYFHYPRLAQRRGWEGEVVLGFRIRPDGGISDIRVVHSSGRALLDRAAIDSLRHVERLPELGRTPGVGTLELEVPITYRLQPA